MDAALLVRGTTTLYGIRGEGRSAIRRVEAFVRQGQFDVKLIHARAFATKDLPEAPRCARDRVEGAIKVVARNALAA